MTRLGWLTVRLLQTILFFLLLTVVIPVGVSWWTWFAIYLFWSARSLTAFMQGEWHARNCRKCHRTRRVWSKI